MQRDDRFLRKLLIIPNGLVLLGAIVLFHRSFLSGYITRVGLLVVFASLLPLTYYLGGRMWTPLKVVTALLNGAFFAMCAYAFAGTVYILARAGMLNIWFYLLTGVTWCAALGMTFAKTQRAEAGLLLNITLVLAGALALYIRSAMKWAPWMNAALYAVIIAVTFLNVWFILTHLTKR